MKNKLFIGFLIFTLTIFSCNIKNQTLPLFEVINNSGIDFINTVKDNDTLNILNYRNFYNGGGVATGDINNDGLPDVFFTANQGSNKLFLNKGNFKFENISINAGFTDKKQFSTGVVMADVNGDGWLDIFVCNAGSMNDASIRSNQLFINNHDLTFTESAEKYGLKDSGYTTQVSFFDYDLDGDLDCFIIDNSPVPVNSLGYPKQRDLPSEKWNVAPNLKGGGDHLFRNDNGHFTEVTQNAGIHGSLMSFGLGVTVGDVNGDGYPDVYVSNDFFERDYLYINQKNGTFKDELEQRIKHNSYASMGADIGDINNDGHPEIFTTDMLPADDYRLKTTLSFDDIDQFRLRERNGFYHQYLQNTLQLNDGSGKFKDIANYSGVNASEWSWGALMFDADNDGLNDLFICNGIYRDLTNQDFLSFDANEIKEKMLATGQKNLADLVNKIPSIAVPNKMFKNLGNLKFEDEGEKWGFTTNSFSNGAAYADLDNDGDIDLIINNVNEPALIYKNKSRELLKNNFIGFDLKGIDKNKFAIGSKIFVYQDKNIFTREIMPSRGFQSSVDYKQSIGIGKSTKIDSVVIRWSNLTSSKIDNVEINKYNIIYQSQIAAKKNNTFTKTVNTLFENTPSNFDKNIDDDYTDFYRERGIPQMLSHYQPKAAVADVNGDGLDDIYIGGTTAKNGQLYLQNNYGQFIKKEEPILNETTGNVDGAILFFDCDNDGDKDLLICSSGNTADPSSKALQHRLFINDGKGNFSISNNSLPLNKDNISVAIANDINGDGYLDLFVGAMCVTGEYGVTPQSHIYLNNGKGIFNEMPLEQCKDIVNVGMVSNAVWADIDGDKKAELIIVGNWMSPKIFKYTNNNFVALKTNIDDMFGWWQTVAVADVNGDGLQDLILGNLGENFYLKPTKENPIKLFINDFDKNGQLDKIITRTIDGKDKPVFMKSELEAQMPILKKQNLHNKDYATKSINDLFSKEIITKSNIKKINYSSSCVAINKGSGNFEIKPFDYPIQLSSANCILPLDINNDGKIDLIIGGNEFGFQPQLGRLDANEGIVLINDGQGNFTNISNQQSGILVTEQVRDILLLNKNKNPKILFLQNNEIPVLYNLKNRN